MNFVLDFALAVTAMQGHSANSNATPAARCPVLKACMPAVFHCVSIVSSDLPCGAA